MKAKAHPESAETGGRNVPTFSKGAPWVGWRTRVFVVMVQLGSLAVRSPLYHVLRLVGAAILHRLGKRRKDYPTGAFARRCS